MTRFDRFIHGALLLAFFLCCAGVSSLAYSQTSGTRSTPCSATTPNNAICITWTHNGKTDDGSASVTGVTFRVEQKFGTGAFATVGTGLTANQYYAQNLAVGTYTFRVYANCSNPACVESVASNEASKGATANPIQPSAPVIIIAALIREGQPPVYRIIQSVNLKPNEVVFAAPASMRPLFADNR